NAFAPLSVIRTTTATTGILGVIAVDLNSSNNIANTFGPSINFRVSDNTISNQTLGALGFVRAGADNTGDFVVTPSLSGTVTERLRVTSSGQVAIGTTTPNASAKLELTSTTQGLLGPRMSQ